MYSITQLRIKLVQTEHVGKVLLQGCISNKFCVNVWLLVYILNRTSTYKIIISRCDWKWIICFFYNMGHLGQTIYRDLFQWLLEGFRDETLPEIWSNNQIFFYSKSFGQADNLSSSSCISNHMNRKSNCHFFFYFNMDLS